MKMMKRVLVLSALLLVAAFLLVSGNAVKAKALTSGCPASVKCDLDGMSMIEEETYYNGIHKSVKYGHDYYGANGKVHHYVIVGCD
jgi:hypothetical protein